MATIKNEIKELRFLYSITYTACISLFLAFSGIRCVGLVPDTIGDNQKAELLVSLPREMLMHIIDLLCDLPSESKGESKEGENKEEKSGDTSEGSEGTHKETNEYEATMNSLTQAWNNLKHLASIKNKQIIDCVIQALYEKYKDRGYSKPFLAALMSTSGPVLYWLDTYIRASDSKKLKDEINQLVPFLGINALMLAVSQNSKGVTTKFLEAGAAPNTREAARGGTPLMLAVKNGFGPMARLLLKYKGKVNAKDTLASQTALHLALSDIDPEKKAELLKIVTLLLKEKADPNAKDIYGQIPLSYAIDHDLQEIAQELIRYGANVNGRIRLTKTGKCMPLLHYIVLSDHLDQEAKLQWLKLFEDSKKLDLAIKDMREKAALWYAQIAQDDQVIDWLTKRYMVIDNNSLSAT